MPFSQSGSLENDIRLRSPNDFGVVLGEGIDKFKAGAKRYKGLAQRKLTNLRYNLQQGPLLSRALERADRIALETGNYKPLAKLAGKRPLYDRLFSGSYGHELGKQYAREALGLPSLSGANISGFERTGKLAGRNIFGRALGAAFTAYSAYSGYQEGGLWGAAKGVGEALAFSYLSGRVIGSMTSGGIMSSVGVGATSAYLGYQGLKLLGSYSAGATTFGIKNFFRDETYEYRRRNSSVDLGTPSIDPFGNNATIRQRSLSAIQNSRLNGRSMLGQEAFLFYKPWG